MTLKEVREAFIQWDDGYDDPPPRLFRRYSAGLRNLVSFALETKNAYELYKKNDLDRVNQMNKRLRKGGKPYSIGTVLPDIVDEYFVHRLFELCYLGAWALLETYLRDVAWLMIARDPSSATRPASESKNTRDEYISRETLATQLNKSLRNLRDIERLYQDVLKTNLNRLQPYKSLSVGRRKRNEVAHSGQAFGYSAYYLQQQKKRQNKLENITASKETLVSEEFLCDALVQMWNLGDLLRKRFFEWRELENTDRGFPQTEVAEMPPEESEGQINININSASP